MFDTGAQVSCISYDCYKKSTLKTKIDINIKAKVSSAEGSNLGPTEVAICSLILGAHEFECKFIVCKHLLCPIILGFDFAQDFRVGMDLNNQGQLYLNQDHKTLTYYKPNSSQDSFNFLSCVK